MPENELPSSYRPFENVWVCGTRFRNGSVILRADSVAVFLIGQGPEHPLVWLKIPSGSPPDGKWKDAVNESEAVVDGFEIVHSEYGSELLFRNHVILQYRVETGTLVITHIDLLPVGLNVGGNVKRLLIAGTTLENNTFDNVGTMIALGS